jgi:hypothetical protein
MHLHLQMKVFGSNHHPCGRPLCATVVQASITIAIAVLVALTSPKPPSRFFIDWMTCVRCESCPASFTVLLHNIRAAAGKHASPA